MILSQNNKDVNKTLIFEIRHFYSAFRILVKIQVLKMLKSVIFLIAISFSVAFDFRSFQTDKSRRPGEVVSLTASEFVRFVKQNPLIAMVANFCKV